jgi:hypothetical protein
LSRKNLYLFVNCLVQTVILLDFTRFYRGGLLRYSCA